MSVRRITGDHLCQWVTEDMTVTATEDGHLLIYHELEIDDRGPRWVSYLATDLEAARDRALALWIAAGDAARRRTAAREPEARQAAEALSAEAREV